MRIRFDNCTLFDGLGAEVRPGMHVMVADGAIAEVSERAIGGEADD